MGILARLFGGVPKTERGGIRLEERDPWEVAPTRDVERFLQALPLLAPEGAIAYFEGTGESHVAKYLREVSVSPAVHVAVGTIWPRLDCYHVPLTITSMEALAVFLTKRPAGYFCSHCNVYRDNSVLLQWHDAFTDDPLYISKAIPADRVATFARALGSSYGSTKAG